MKTKLTLNGFKHRTPSLWNWVSIFLIGYATYQPMLMEWVYSAPFGNDTRKDLVMAWFDWLFPALGIVIQFTHKVKNDNDAQ